MRYFLFILCLSTLFACNTERQAQKKVSWLLSRGLLDDACAKFYPVVDSAGEVVSDTAKADNPDYTGVIDSISRRLDSIRQKAESDRFTAEAGHEQCLSVVDQQAAEIKRLEQTVSRIRSEYKPCKPTVITNTQTIWRPDSAAISRLNGVIEAKEKQVNAAHEATNRANLRADKNEKWKWYFFGLVALNVLFVIFRLFIYKRPI